METRFATAPYNFVAVPNKAVEAPLAKFIKNEESYNAGFIKYIEKQGKLCGEIEYTLTNLTPMYIGDHGNFFARDGKPIIPGSTMRGLVKNYLKIISCGTMRAGNNEDVTSRHLYFRDVAGKNSPLKKAYAERMVKDIDVLVTRDNEDDNGTYKEKQTRRDADVSAGFLIKVDHKWFICPVPNDSWKVCRYEVEKDDNGKEKYVIKSRMNNKTRKREEYKEYFYINGFRDKEYKPHVNWYDTEVEIHTGKMKNKGHYYKFKQPDWNNKIEVDDTVIEEYKADTLKKKPIPGINLLDGKYSKTRMIAANNNFQHLVPCFYVGGKESIESIGSTKYYRIPYLKSIEEHIPKDLRNPHKIDFADAIFGRKEDWAGRVYFEDGYLKENAGTLEKSKPHNLMGPNPTSFQLYLQQDDSKTIRHWDEDTNIRGYKMYWHNNIGEKDWMLGKGEKDIKDTISIRPLNKGNVFQGKARFNNLSVEELGALLAVFKLSEQGCFKIGMGKPIGMGSVKCQYKLNLYDTSKLYTKLFDGEGWNTAKSKADIKPYIETFKTYMSEQVSKLNITQEYEKILEDLSIMMSWENTEKKGWNKNLEYMPIGVKTDTRYKDRVPLPTPKEVVNPTVKKK